MALHTLRFLSTPSSFHRFVFFSAKTPLVYGAKSVLKEYSRAASTPADFRCKRIFLLQTTSFSIQMIFRAQDHPRGHLLEPYSQGSVY